MFNWYVGTIKGVVNTSGVPVSNVMAITLIVVLKTTSFVWKYENNKPEHHVQLISVQHQSR